jgi:hypothetical protein
METVKIEEQWRIAGILTQKNKNHVKLKLLMKQILKYIFCYYRIRQQVVKNKSK